MNIVILAGNLTKNPEMHTTANGVEYALFTVACQRNYKNADGKYDADFIQCKAWRKTAEFVSKYFQKGSRIGVRGRLTVSSYDDQNGNRRWNTEVAVDEVEFAGGRNDPEKGNAGSQPKSYDPMPGEPDYGDDIDQDFEPLPDSELPF